jgi:hypothetical protein
LHEIYGTIYHERLYKNGILFDPKNLIIPSASIYKIAELANVNRDEFAVQLKQFADQYNNFCATMKNIFSAPIYDQAGASFCVIILLTITLK